MSPASAAERGLTSTFCAPVGNLAPEGSVIKSTCDRPVGDRRRRRLSFHRPGQGLRHRARRDRRHQGGTHSRRRRARADLPRPARCRHGGDLSAHLRAQVPALRQARRAAHRCAVQRRLDRRVHRPRLARSALGRTDRQAARRRPRRDRHRPRHAARHGQFRRRRGRQRRRRGRCTDSPGAGSPAPIWHPIPACRTTPACGRRCRTSAAAPGAAASSTSSRSSRCSRQESRRCSREDAADAGGGASGRRGTRDAHWPCLAARRRRPVAGRRPRRRRLRPVERRRDLQRAARARRPAGRRPGRRSAANRQRGRPAGELGSRPPRSSVRRG